MTPAQPVYPLIAIERDRSMLDLLPDSIHLAKVSALTLITQEPEEYIYFDAAGNKWTCWFSARWFRNNLFTRILAHTFYNPTYDAVKSWTLVGSYTIAELQKDIADCVEADDDIVTQFAEAKDIEEAISKTTTFAEIVQVLNKFVFDVDEEALWKEFGKESIN